MLRCLNCTLRVQRIQRHPVNELSSELQSILVGWLASQLPVDAVICHACYIIVNEDVNETDPRRRLGHTNICVGCGCSVSNIRNHHLEENSPLLNVFQWNINLPGHRNQLCHPCWLRGNRRLVQDAQRVTVETPLPPEQPLSPVENVPLEAPAIVPVVEQGVLPLRTIILPNYKRVANTSSRCIYNMCQNAAGRLVPTFIEVMLIKEYNFYVPRSARVCDVHLLSSNWQTLPETGNTLAEFNVTQIEDIINLAKKEISFDFDNVHEMPNHICHYWTGLDVSEFLTLFNELSLDGYVTSPKSSLAIYLIKLRTGDSNKRLSSLFQMPRTTLERRMKKVREYLMGHFVPLHIGLQHITAQDISNRNLSIPNALFGSPNSNVGERPAIVICDGTYIYIEKSSNYLYQKKTYSLHKYSNLVKPFLMVCCDGHIIDVIGPYAATQTDADIMIDLFRQPSSPMRTFFRENDVFILDRGFRDAIPLLESCNYKVFKPESLNEGESQLSTLQANKSRCVTLCRWVVEVVNGRFKRDFKIFRQDFFNTAHKHLIDDFKVAAALLNRFHPLIRDRSDAQMILNRALYQLHRPNHLAQFVAAFHLNRRRVMFSRIDGNLPQLESFPRFTYDQLILFSLGPYQVKQARSYYGEHIRENGIYEVEVCPQLEHSEEMVSHVGGNQPCLLRGRIKSRHISQREYFTYILFDTETISQSPFDLILGYYCSCLVGNRTVGCCCHVMTIIWFLGWARYEENITAPASYLDNILIEIED